MVLGAYLAGLLTLPALIAGVALGHAWWARWRRSEGASDAPVRLTVLPPPPPPHPQDRPRINRVSYANRLGPTRALRGRHPRSG
jgi:hypothetical protein